MPYHEHGYNRDVQRYAAEEDRRIRGCQNKMNEIEKMLESCKDKIANYNDYGQAVLQSLYSSVDYMYYENKLSEKASARWEKLRQRYRDAE